MNRSIPTGAARRTAARRTAARGDRRRRPATGDRRGVTLVELIVALLVLSIGLMSLASVSGTVARQLAGGNQQTVAAMVVQSRFDSLASVAPCRSIVANGASRGGTAVTRGVSERWQIRDLANVIQITDTISFRGRARPLTYTSLIPCRD